MYASTIDILEKNNTVRYSISQDGADVSYAKVLDLWQTDDHFKDYFTSLLSESSFSAFRWETPALTEETAMRPFEFVLINAPEFVNRRTDSNTYQDYFEDENEGVVSFSNLRNDATLVVPSPCGDEKNYGHLAAFVRGADQNQIGSLWRVIGQAVTASLSKAPVWVSTAGGGVAWLHVRIDSRPKYYSYTPYKAV